MIKGRAEASLTWRQRRLLAMAMVAVVCLYVPINRTVTGGVTVEIWLDGCIPLWPIWIVPYVLSIVWWGIALLWAFAKMESGLYLRFIVSWMSACLIGFAIFVLYPTYMVRPEVTGNGWGEKLIQLLYASDRTYNAFPSQHLWDTVIITLTWSRWKPRWRWLLWGGTVIVALSTVFTKQHWILDLLGGTGLAVVSYHAVGPLVVKRILPVWARRWREEGRQPDRGGGLPCRDSSL